MKTAADAQQRHWDEQKEQGRLNRERLEKQAKEQQKENDRLKKEQSKSKNFFGSALVAVCKVIIDAALFLQIIRDCVLALLGLSVARK
jgi:hypothetical protein